MDLVKNFAYSTVLTAPSPPTSGTTVTLQSGDGAKFPPVPFNVEFWPAPGPEPLIANAEICRCTAVSGDTLTIVRQTTTETVNQSRAILVGDQVMAPISAKSLTDIGLPAQISALTAVGHSWLDTGAFPPESMGRLSLLARLCSMLGVHEDNLLNLTLSGSYLSGVSNGATAITGSLFGGWSGVAQFVLPDASPNVYGTPAFVFGASSSGAVAGPPAIIVHGVNDPAYYFPAWP